MLENAKKYIVLSTLALSGTVASSESIKKEEQRESSFISVSSEDATTKNDIEEGYLTQLSVENSKRIKKLLKTNDSDKFLGEILYSHINSKDFEMQKSLIDTLVLSLSINELNKIIDSILLSEKNFAVAWFKYFLDRSVTRDDRYLTKKCEAILHYFFWEK